MTQFFLSLPGHGPWSHANDSILGHGHTRFCAFLPWWVQFLTRCFSPIPQLDEHALQDPQGNRGEWSGSNTKKRKVRWISPISKPILSYTFSYFEKNLYNGLDPTLNKKKRKVGWISPALTQSETKKKNNIYRTWYRKLKQIIIWNCQIE